MLYRGMPVGVAILAQKYGQMRQAFGRMELQERPGMDFSGQRDTLRMIETGIHERH